MIRKTVRLGDLLVSEGLITNDQLMHVLKLQKEFGFSKKMGEIMIDEGYITQKQVSQVLSKQPTKFAATLKKPAGIKSLLSKPETLCTVRTKNFAAWPKRPSMQMVS